MNQTTKDVPISDGISHLKHSQTKSGAAQIAHVDSSLYTRGSGSEVCHVRNRGTARSFFREGHDDIAPTWVGLDVIYGCCVIDSDTFPYGGFLK